MKLSCQQFAADRLRSLPVRGAWVEMVFLKVGGGWRISSLPVRGAWVEMRRRRPVRLMMARRSPCGERGLK